MTEPKVDRDEQASGAEPDTGGKTDGGAPARVKRPPARHRVGFAIAAAAAVLGIVLYLALRSDNPPAGLILLLFAGISVLALASELLSNRMYYSLLTGVGGMLGGLLAAAVDPRTSVTADDCQKAVLLGLALVVPGFLAHIIRSGRWEPEPPEPIPWAAIRARARTLAGKFATWRNGGRLLVLLGLAAFRFIAGYVPAPEEVKFSRPRTYIRSKDNAFTYFEKAREQLVWPKERHEETIRLANGMAWDAALAEELVEKNSKTFEFLDQALACSACKVPYIKWLGTVLPYLSTWQEFGCLASIKAEYLFRQGQEREAFDACVAFAKGGRMMQGAQNGCTIHYQIGTAVRGTMLERLRSMTSRTELEAAHLRRYANMLAAYPSDEALADAHRTDYEVISRSVAIFQQTCPWGLRWFYFQPNRICRPLREILRVNVENSGRTWSKVKPVPMPPPPVRRSLLGFACTPNALGAVMCQQMSPNLSSVGKRKCALNVAVGATKLFLALRAYQLEKGSLPQSLDALVPAYIDSVPLDDFDGQPMRYSPDQKFVYSVGSDLIDGGGEPGRTLPAGVLIYLIDFPPRAEKD